MNRYDIFMEELQSDIDTLREVVKANPRPEIPEYDFDTICATFTVLLCIKLSIVTETIKFNNNDQKYVVLRKYLERAYKELDVFEDDPLKPVYCACIKSLYNKLKEDDK